jgi:hypothetical protein
MVLLLKKNAAKVLTPAYVLLHPGVPLRPGLNFGGKYDKVPA